MKIVVWLLFSLSFFYAACHSNSREKPNILSQDKMEAVLWDMIRADLFITNYLAIKDSSVNKNAEGIRMYNRILKIHNVSENEFKQSFFYYRSRPDLLKVIMDSISHMPEEKAVPQNTKPIVKDSAM